MRLFQKITVLIGIVTLLTSCSKNLSLVCQGTETTVKEAEKTTTIGSRQRIFTLETIEEGKNITASVDTHDFQKVLKTSLSYAGESANSDFSLVINSGYLRLTSVENYSTFREKRSFEGICQAGVAVR